MASEQLTISSPQKITLVTDIYTKNAPSEEFAKDLFDELSGSIVMVVSELHGDKVGAVCFELKASTE